MKEQIINRIIKETESTSYLEIGYGDGHNFDKIEADIKFAIDPKAEIKKNNILAIDSDEFFKNNDKVFDVVFVDGYHSAEQARKDITNALKVVTDKGCVILHDTLPKSKEMQEVPRKTKQWTGDVWKAAVGFIQSYPDVKVETYRADFGLTVIYPEGKTSRKHFEKIDLTYEEFDKDRVELLNIID